jgi:putative ATP-dependent endonuclease of OLD family
MFFTRIPVFVEGLEDASYITTALHLSGQWGDFRRLGCHIIPMNGKDKLIQPLAIAKELGIPAFVVFDADSNSNPQHIPKHEKDNKALMHLLGIVSDPFPADNSIGKDHAIWRTNLTEVVHADFGNDADKYKNTARVHYAHEAGLEKHDLFIADWLSEAHKAGKTSPTLTNLCTAILNFAEQA